MNAKNRIEANRSRRSINLEVLPSEADKKTLVLSFGDKGGAEQAKMIERDWKRVREGELETAKSRCRQV